MSAIRPFYQPDGSPYTEGAVFSRLIEKPFDMIIGLDFGYGETSAYRYAEASKDTWIYRRLQFGHDYEDKLLSCISYVSDPDGGERVLVGKEAAQEPDFLPYFKIDPSRWDEQADLRGHSFGRVVRDYITAAWDMLLRYNEEVREVCSGKKEKSFLIVAGCPSCPEWLSPDSRAAYKKLITEVTRCAHVEVIPEYTAALIVPMLNKMTKKRRGIAIYDLGSLSTEFTYIRYGEKMIVKSLPLGGWDIDRAMLRRVLSDNAISGDTLSISQLNSACMCMRLAKEEYYSQGKPAEAVVGLSEISLNALVDDDFMRMVLHEDREMQLPFTDYKDCSWMECFEKFVERTSLLIADAPCDLVLLTGGTSRIGDVKETCRHIYGQDKVKSEEDPAGTVAKGLCLMKGRESRFVHEFDLLRTVISTEIDSECDTLIHGFAGDIHDIVWPVLIEFLDETIALDQDTYSFALLLDPLWEKVYPCCETTGAAQAETKLVTRIKECHKECEKEILSSVNDIVSRMYSVSTDTGEEAPEPVRVAASRPLLSRNDLKSLTHELEIVDWLSLYGILVLHILMDPYYSTRPSSGVYYYFLKKHAENESLKSELEDLHRTLQKEIPAIDGRKMVKTARRLVSRENTIRKVLGERFEKPLKDSIEKVFRQLCSETLELAIGKALFWIFEENI